MKLDDDLIKEILEDVEENGDGVTPITFKVNLSDFKAKNEAYKKYTKRRHHCRLLFDAGLVRGGVSDYPTVTDGLIPCSFHYTELTLEGYKVLECLRDEETSSKIKDALIKVGKESLKQAPTLALAVIMKFAGL